MTFSVYLFIFFYKRIPFRNSYQVGTIPDGLPAALIVEYSAGHGTGLLDEVRHPRQE